MGGVLRELLYCSVVVALKCSIAIQNENVEAIGVGCGLFLVQLRQRHSLRGSPGLR